MKVGQLVCFEALSGWYLIDMTKKYFVRNNNEHPILRPSLHSLISKNFSSPLQGSLRKPSTSSHYICVLQTILKHLK